MSDVISNFGIAMVSGDIKYEYIDSTRKFGDIVDLNFYNFSRSLIASTGFSVLGRKCFGKDYADWISANKLFVSLVTAGLVSSGLILSGNNVYILGMPGEFLGIYTGFSFGNYLCRKK